MTAIETDRLTKRFRLLSSYRDLLLYPWRHSAKLAVEDVSLNVAEGELFGLLGENGAGKTTLIRMLSTTLLPTAGRAAIAGYDVVREPQRVRRLIGLVTGEERSFYWRLTGRQNLAYFAALYHVPRRETRARVDALLDTLAVREVADRPFNTYSAGTRQRFAVARGLLTDPQVLFLDEPTRSLDPIAADSLRTYIRGHIIGELRRTILLATHTLSEAQAICDRIGIIRHGRLVALGTMLELRQRTRLTSVVEIAVDVAPAELIARIERVPGVREVATTFGGAGGGADGPAGAQMHIDIDAGGGVLDEVLRQVIACGAAIQSCSTREPTLEEIYRAIHAEESEAA